MKELIKTGMGKGAAFTTNKMRRQWGVNRLFSDDTALIYFREELFMKDCEKRILQINLWQSKIK